MEYTIEHGDDTFDLVFSATAHGRHIPATRNHPGEEPEIEIVIEQIGKNGGELAEYGKDHPDYALIEGLLVEKHGKHYSEMEQKFIESCCDDRDDDDRYDSSAYRLRR